MKLRVSGEGNVGMAGGPKGDLYVVITVKDHHVFKREGNDLFIDVPVPVSQAVLGTAIRIPTLEGKTELKIPAGTQPGTRFRLKGKGIKKLQSYGHGDLYIVVDVQIPKNISSQEKSAFQTIADMRDDKKKLDQVLEKMH